MKLFCVSDIHSHWEPFKTALDAVGFEENNKNHLLVVLGDVFDRGPNTVQVYEFLNSLTNVVLIRGNHEDLLEEMLARGYGEKHDIVNGTVTSVCDLCDITGVKTKSTYEVCKAVEELIKPFLSKFVNYFQTKNYIFCHSWIPCKVKFKDTSGLNPLYASNIIYEYMPDWREANEVEWEEARWGNPFKMAEAGLNQTGKILVFGHWGTYENRPREYEGEDLFDPVYGEGYIGLDATTALSGQVNVIVLEDELLEKN